NVRRPEGLGRQEGPAVVSRGDRRVRRESVVPLADPRRAGPLLRRTSGPGSAAGGTGALPGAGKRRLCPGLPRLRLPDAAVWRRGDSRLAAEDARGRLASRGI